MKLEKSKETVWSIKRKDIAGKFVLRSTESSGKLVKVSISLVNEQNTEVSFQMNYLEFKNFFGILSSFKELIESSEHLAQNQNISEEVPILEKSIKSERISDDLDLKAISETLDNLDLGLAAVKSLGENKIKRDLNMPNIPINLRQAEKKKNIQQPVETNPQKRKMLKETDWDPW
ncbi:hypothetical protein [Candidatus Lokiarchaeum ossiferum]|uniref:hypothetical protein n=1 Tax=Candidatus Lokiarchaeum ossiferum TaxID=2951803 RepID=UPI00352ED451